MDKPEVRDTWELGHRYEDYVGRWSRQVALRFVSGLGVPAGKRWLDVGCGTGALCAAILENGSPASVTGVEPSAGFIESARRALQDDVEFRMGSACSIPLDDAAVDVVVSGLVLNFVPDPAAALIEMKRVAKPGGTLAAYVWDYAGQMELMRYFWEAAASLDPAAAELDEGARFPMCQPDTLQDLFSTQGLDTTKVWSIDVPTVFADFDDYWQPFLGGQGPAPSYATSLDEQARDRLRDRLRAELPVRPDGTIALMARAWAVRGTCAEQDSN